MDSQDVGHVAVDLSEEFADRVTHSTVVAVVDRAERDLRGQVRAGAFPELVHRLAWIRLARLTA